MVDRPDGIYLFRLHRSVWLLSFSLESLQLLLSPAMATATAVAMAMVATVVDMVDMAEATTARGMLMLRLPLLLRLMPSPAMDTDVSMVDTADTTARGPLMLRPSPDMDTMAVAMDMVATDTDVSMVDTADTTDKFKSSGINLHSFTATFILVLK